MQKATIRVSTALRDQLRERARAEGVTLAGAIESALDASDERECWTAVRKEHDALSREERLEYLRSGLDDLSDAADDQLSERNEW